MGNLLMILGLGGHAGNDGKRERVFPARCPEASVEERELRSKRRGKIVKIHGN